MNARSSKLRIEELDMIDDEIRTVLQLIKSNTQLVCNGLAPVTQNDLKNIASNESLDNHQPLIILKCVRNILDAIRAGKIETTLDEEELAFTIGHTIAKYSALFLDWNMKFLKCNFMPDGEVAVISKDNKYVLYPSLFIYKLLDDSSIDNTIMLSLNMYKDQGFPPSEKNFEVLMG